MKRTKNIVLIIVVLLITMGIINSMIYIYSISASFSPRILQSGVYVLILLSTLFFIAISKKSLQSVGLFRFRLVRQIIVGGIIGGMFLFIGGIFTGWHFFSNGYSLYFFLSQLLVAFSEELLFRGYLLEMLKDVVKTSDRAVIISALIFGLWHYPISHNIVLVVITFFTGAIYGTLRTVFEKTDDEIGIISLSVSHWIFNVIL
ncbi:CAAX amino terminal protease self-immunity [Blautia hydrogenotrophica]|uniref:CPBP family intramembrane glutamic endopeptidase n=1 Tax=Blautia hydrogenotrophica TaxID=53443 RepID=UPI0006C5ACBB|nr:CPBP family intramembrane glutamic endopeptidase [Blautia hydrogenotrophica]CUM79911.1 CAAX amino terminal protease self-immunity [Blautia hydrogenotrophica]SCH39040.1 CAAX amino terminal protease self-immunity [uncultured Blautia sp.]